MPKKLNELRGKMLGERARRMEADPTVKYRVAERSYKPILQVEDGLIEGTERKKWLDVQFPLPATPQ